MDKLTDTARAVLAHIRGGGVMGQTDHLAAQPCPMGGTHTLTNPTDWIGTSCRKCHRTWTGTDLVPTWPDPPSTAEVCG